MADTTVKRMPGYYYYKDIKQVHQENPSKNNARKLTGDFSSPVDLLTRRVRTRFNDGVGESSNRNQINPQEEPPLGLALKMPPSEINRLELALSKESQQNKHQESPVSQRHHNSFKACNIPALSLKIGNWEWESKHEGDLVAKFYYSTKKLVWEVLYGALKKKIEIRWCQISAINAYADGNNTSHLEIQLKEHPKLYEEMQLNPKMRTKWENTGNDFTGGQASICSQHIIKFPRRVLDGPFKNLLECDKRLSNLTKQPFPYQNPPHFQHQILDFSSNKSIHECSPIIPNNNYHQGTSVPYAPNLDQPIIPSNNHQVLKSPSMDQSGNNLIPEIRFDEQDDIISNLEMDSGILNDLKLPELLEMETNDAEFTNQETNFKTDQSYGMKSMIADNDGTVFKDDSSNEVKNHLAYLDDEMFSVCDPFDFHEPNSWLHPEFNILHEFSNGGNDVNQIGFADDDELFVFQNLNSGARCSGM